MHTKDTRRMVLCAICIAVCFVVTRFLAVPALYTKGYVNLGDVTVLLIAYIIGGSYGALSAGIGSCMADASMSFYYYVPATFVIKALMVLIADFFFEHAKKKSSKKLMFLWIVSGVIIAEVFMVAGYFLYELILYKKGAFASVAGNLIQAVTCAVPSVILIMIFQSNAVVRKILKNQK